VKRGEGIVNEKRMDIEALLDLLIY